MVSEYQKKYRQAELVGNTGKQNSGISVAKEGSTNGVLFKRLRVDAAIKRDLRDAWKEGEHHEQVTRTLKPFFKSGETPVVPFLGQWLDESGQPVVAMKFIPGTTLLEDYSQGKVSRKQLFEIYQSKIIPRAKLLIDKGFYHCDLNPGNIIDHPIRGPVILDIDHRRTFLFPADQPAEQHLNALQRLIKRRKSIMYHILWQKELAQIKQLTNGNLSKPLPAEASTRSKAVLHQLLVADVKRSFIQFAYFRGREVDPGWLRKMKDSFYTWMNKPPNRWALELINTCMVYQPFWSFKSLPMKG